MKKQYTKQKEDLRNPSRGFYVQIKSNKLGRVEELHEEGYRLVLVAYDIAEYTDDRIDDKKLKELDDVLDEIRNYHMKAIVRPAYGFEDSGHNDAGSFVQLEEHVEQIADVINANKDVILCTQAGFLGPWGEWHSSIYLSGEEEEKREYRNRLLQKLLEEYDSSIIINVRRPRFLRDAQKAGLDISRMGFHNDGLLASESDLGTYDDLDYTREEELQYINSAIKTGINGGEMPELNSFSGASNAAKEFGELKVSYLNAKYNKEVLQSWREETLEGENGYTYIEKRLGYRYFVKEVKVPRKIGELPFLKDLQQIKLKITNKGFAPIEDGYQAQWVIEYRDGMVGYQPVLEEFLSMGNTGEQDLVFDFRDVNKNDVSRIGIQIYDGRQQFIAPEDCVEIANSDFSFEEGVNYILVIDEQGRIEFLTQFKDHLKK
ncbi:DUF4874 domain-containing protein [Faecalicatena contorta]|nr:DUF4874 domain-containing protein [Faecalicatena contorta]